MKPFTSLPVLFGVILFPTLLFSQSAQPLAVKCHIVADLFGTEVNHKISSGAGFKMRYHFTDRFFTEFRTFRAVYNEGFKQFDEFAASDVYFKRYHHLNAFAGHYFLQINGARSSRFLGGRAGYYYYQHAMPYYPDYWATGYNASGELRSLSGVMIHSGFAGIDFLSLIRRKNPDTRNPISRQHHVYADFLYGFHAGTTGIRQDASGTVHTDTPGKKYGLKPFGARIGYEFTHHAFKRFGYNLGFESSWKPVIDYKHNPALYIPRGGEGIRQSIEFSVKLGVSFIQEKRP